MDTDSEVLCVCFVGPGDSELIFPQILFADTKKQLLIIIVDFNSGEYIMPLLTIEPWFHYLARTPASGISLHTKMLPKSPLYPITEHYIAASPCPARATPAVDLFAVILCEDDLPSAWHRGWNRFWYYYLHILETTIGQVELSSYGRRLRRKSPRWESSDLTKTKNGRSPDSTTFWTHWDTPSSLQTIDNLFT